MKTWSKPTAGSTNTPGGATNLNDLADVAISTPQANQVLKYDGSTFINSEVPGLADIQANFNNLNADNLTAGTINYSRLPNLAGVVLSGDAVPPYISSITPITPTGTQEIEILGEYFSPITQLSISGVTVNSLEVRSPNKIIASISKSGLSGLKIITLSNGLNSNQVWSEGIKSVNILADPYLNNVVFFLRRSLIDSSQNPKNIAVFGSVEISTEQAKYGGSSIKFTRGMGNYLIIPGNNDFIFPADFTIEGWIRWDGIETNGGAVLIATGGSGSMDQLGIFSGGLLGYGSLSNPFNVSPGIWHHVAISRSAGIVRGFLNGIQQHSITNTSSIGSSTNILYIGRRSDNHPWGGYIDSLRITKGIGRYTASFNLETDTFLNT